MNSIDYNGDIGICTETEFNLCFYGMKDDNGFAYEGGKAAFIEWLTRYARRRGLLLPDGTPGIRAIAKSLDVSAQSVSNWYAGHGLPASVIINDNICTAEGITPSQFWEQLQNIYREMKGEIPAEREMTAEEVLYSYKQLTFTEQNKVKLELLLDLTDTLRSS